MMIPRLRFALLLLQKCFTVAFVAACLCTKNHVLDLHDAFGLLVAALNDDTW